MKKILLSAAVAAACAVPAAAMAETTLYGNFRWSINDVDSGAAGDNLTANNNASRLGVKGAIGEGDLKGIYHLQMGAQNDAGGTALSSRFYFAGLKGNFGSLIYGRHSTAYKMAGVKMDPFYDTSAGPAFGGSSYGLSPDTNGFTDNSLAYTTPKLGGAVTVNAALYLDDGVADDHDYNVGAQYSKNGITGGVQYVKTEQTSNIANARDDADAIRIYGGYKNKMFAAGLSYEQIDAAGDTNGEDTYLFATGSYNVTPKVKLAASYGKVEDAVVGGGRNGNGDGFAFGAFYKILPKTTLSGLYSTVDYDAAGVERDVISFGVVQSF